MNHIKYSKRYNRSKMRYIIICRTSMLLISKEDSLLILPNFKHLIKKCAWQVFAPGWICLDSPSSLLFLWVFLGKIHYSAPVKKNVLMSAFLDTVFKGDWNITGGDIFVYDNFIKRIWWKLYAFWKLLIADNH